VSPNLKNGTWVGEVWDFSTEFSGFSSELHSSSHLWEVTYRISVRTLPTNVTICVNIPKITGTIPNLKNGTWVGEVWDFSTEFSGFSSEQGRFDWYYKYIKIGCLLTSGCIAAAICGKLRTGLVSVRCQPM